MRACLLAAALRPTPMARLATGGEYDADTVFDTALAVLAEVAALDGRPVAGIAATSVGESCVLIDAEGRAVAPAIAWFDRRTMPEAAEIAERLSADRLFHSDRSWPRVQLHAGEAPVDASALAWSLCPCATRTDDGGLDRVPSLGRRRDRPDASTRRPKSPRYRAGNEWLAPLALAGLDPEFPAPVHVGGTAIGSVRTEVLEHMLNQ